MAKLKKRSTEPSKVSKTFPVEDVNGNKHILKATVISVSQERKKSAGRSDEITDDMMQTLGISERIIRPPLNQYELSVLQENSSELSQIIDAMKIGVVGFGGRVHRRVLPEAIEHGFESQILAEKQLLETFFQFPNPDGSWTKLVKNTWEDYESNGNAYWELIPSMSRDGKYSCFNKLDVATMRIVRLDNMFTKFGVNYIDNNFTLKKQYFIKKFRRFVQIVGNKKVFFKEFGDPRVIDKRTGEVADEKVLPAKFWANEVYHWKLYCSRRTPYGLPRYTGNIIAVMGSRSADETNIITQQNNHVPSMAIMVSGGQLTEGSVNRIKDFVDTQIKSESNYSKFLIIEGEGTHDSLSGTGSVKVEIQPLTSAQHSDQLWQDYDKNNSDKLRRSFRMPAILIGKCHSADTQYLTSTGWKTYDEVLETDTLATMNASTGGIEFQIPSACHVYDYDGQLLHLQNRGIDALVTGNHRMWTRPTAARHLSIKPWRFIEAQQLNEVLGGNGGHLELPVSAAWEGEKFEVFNMPRGDGENSWNPSKPTKNPTEDLARYRSRDGWEVDGDTFLRFLGYFVAEGSTSSNPGCISLSQGIGDTAERMVETCLKLGFDPSIINSRDQELTISFSHMGLRNWLRDNCGTGSLSKRLPDFALNVSSEQLQILLDALIEGDGHRPPLGSPGSFSYCTISKVLNDQLHEICLKLGIALTTRIDDRSSLGHNNAYVSYGHRDSRHLLNPKKHITSVDYVGKVACFTVPNGLLVTKRNGRVLISGNSDDYSKAGAQTAERLAEKYVFNPEREEFDLEINKILIQQGIRFHVWKTHSPNVTDDENLVRILTGAERTGGMTPRISRQVLEDILNRKLPPFPDKDETGFDPDLPFSYSLAKLMHEAGQASANGTNEPQGQTPKAPGQPGRPSNPEKVLKTFDPVAWIHQLIAGAEHMDEQEVEALRQQVEDSLDTKAFGKPDRDFFKHEH